MYLDTDGRWERQQYELEDLFTDLPRVQTWLIFLDTSSLTSDGTLRNRIGSLYSIPQCMWSLLCQRSNGYFGCGDTTNEAGALSPHSSWVRFHIKQLTDGPMAYVWQDFTFFSTWQPGKSRILCFDIDSLFQNQIYTLLANSFPFSPSDIYFMHVALVGLVLESFDV